MINLIVNRYASINRERNQELDWCYQENLANPNLNVFPIEKPDNPTLAYMIMEANEFASNETITVLANSDIVFDDSILLTESIPAGVVYALSRWEPLINYTNKQKIPLLGEVDDDGIQSSWFYNFQGIKRDSAEIRVASAHESQDAWIWRGKLNVHSSIGNFKMGKPGADNKFAAELSRAGYRIYNPAKDIKVYHVHGSGVRTYEDHERVDGPYLEVPLCFLSEIPTINDSFRPTDIDDLRPSEEDTLDYVRACNICDQVQHIKEQHVTIKDTQSFLAGIWRDTAEGALKDKLQEYLNCLSKEEYRLIESLITIGNM